MLVDCRIHSTGYSWTFEIHDMIDPQELAEKAIGRSQGFSPDRITISDDYSGHIIKTYKKGEDYKC